MLVRFLKFLFYNFLKVSLNRNDATFDRHSSQFKPNKRIIQIRFFLMYFC